MRRSAKRRHAVEGEVPLLQPCPSRLPLHAAPEPPQVLVYDDAGEHAVCPLFKIAQLRALGVTVFYNLNGTRERGPVPDAPAVCV